MTRYEGRADAITAPAQHGFAITPNDSTDLTAETRGLYVGTSGDLSLVLASGDAVLLAGAIGGVVLPLRVRRVKATGTTATQLVGLY
jgi:hypothetical protein